MIRTSLENRTKFKVNQSYKGEPLEEKLQRIVETKEPVEATSPRMYTERAQGVLPETDIRTDRWEIAQEAMNRVSKSQIAKRTAAFEKNEPSEPIQATSENGASTI